jgi:outer membrane protein
MKTLFAAAAAVALIAGASAASAQDFQPKEKGTLMVNFRATTVAPDESAPIKTGAGAATGLSAAVSDDTIPSLGIAYFITDKLAIDVTLGTSKHEIDAAGAGPDVRVHETWVLPPVVALQYHPMPAARVSPYVGAGINYMLFYNGSDRNGFKVELDDGFGLALQAGVDIAVQGPWSVNMDAKKVFFETDADINNGALKSNVELDPWVVSVGLGRKF